MFVLSVISQFDTKIFHMCGKEISNVPGIKVDASEKSTHVFKTFPIAHVTTLLHLSTGAPKRAFDIQEKATCV